MRTRLEPERQLAKYYASLKEMERDLSSIGPNMGEVRERMKKKIAAFQEEINKFKRENGIPLNKQK